jgi:hypothetical protein
MPVTEEEVEYDAWSESNDAYEEFVPSYAVEVDYETWCDYYGDECSIAWRLLEDARLPILDQCTFPEFIRFVYEKSSKYPPKY